MFDLFLHLVITVLSNLATFASLATALLVIASLAIAGSLPQADDIHVEFLEFDPETLRNRRRRLRPLPRRVEDNTPPATPLPVERDLAPAPAAPPVNPEDNYIVPPRQ